MRLISFVLSLFSLQCFNLKAEVDKKVSLSNKIGNNQSYLTDIDILNLKKIINNNENLHKYNHKELNVPKLNLPSLFPKKENNFQIKQSNQLKIPNKVNSSIQSHLKCCGIEVKVAKPKPKGHYEKIVRKVENYFWVEGKRPSGMPGAFLVSEREAKGHLGLERR